MTRRRAATRPGSRCSARSSQELGATSVDEATALAGAWADARPGGRPGRARRTPWANTAYVADLVLRLALAEDYLARRAVTAPEARDALRRECAEVTAALEPTP